MKKLLKEPLIHFLILGVAIFALNAWREKARPIETSIARIDVTAAAVDRLRAGFERQFGQTPDLEEMRGLVTAHIREEVLCREALALGLDRDDTIVRRRLAQKMEFLTDDIVAATETDDATLQRYFAENAQRYAKPARISFRHVYLSREKRGAGAEVAARAALADLGKGVSDESLGDPFLHGFDFAEREPAELAALFGREFAEQVAATSEGEWRGPISSSYGLHLVRVERRSGPRPVQVSEVRETVIRDFNDERRRAANREVFERLKARYQVTVDEGAIAQAAASASKTARR